MFELTSRKVAAGTLVFALMIAGLLLHEVFSSPTAHPAAKVILGGFAVGAVLCGMKSAHANWK